MINYSTIFKKIVILLFPLLTILCSCTNNSVSTNDQLPIPKVKAGTAKILGSIINFPQENRSEPIPLHFYVNHPVSAEPIVYDTNLKENGNFEFELPIESESIAFFESEKFDLVIYLVPGEETTIDISFDESGEMQITSTKNQILTPYDILNLPKVLDEYIYTDPEPETRNKDYNIKPDDYALYVISRFEKKMKMLNGNPDLSEKAKDYISTYLKSYYVITFLLDYPGEMHRLYLNTREDKDAPDNFILPEPDRNYYAFLKYFDLNNPKHLYTFSHYVFVLYNILSNKTLNIPDIGESDIKDWLKEVKAIMADLIGSDTGLFYDLLVSNAYAKQILAENKPLSDKQKENISRYFADKSFADILLAKNNEKLRIIEEIKNKINETPSVQKEKLMDTIISKYKGKKVVVDFWATWCGPCLDAMNKCKDLKNEMKDTDVVFVYITDSSSPKNIWERKVNEIGGEHYYLTQEESNNIFKGIGFTSIPTYLFYDTNGILQTKITGFPGVEKMEEMIVKLQ
jgi:thiol-disulfide isomerase/thioredoxin